MDTLLKYMLLSLHNSLRANFVKVSKQFASEILSLGNQVKHIENSMEEITTTVNYLVEANDDAMEEHKWTKAKLADLQD